MKLRMTVRGVVGFLLPIAILSLGTFVLKATELGHLVRGFPGRQIHFGLAMFPAFLALNRWGMKLPWLVASCWALAITLLAVAFYSTVGVFETVPGTSGAPLGLLWSAAGVSLVVTFAIMFWLRPKKRSLGTNDRAV